MEEAERAFQAQTLKTREHKAELKRLEEEYKNICEDLNNGPSIEKDSNTIAKYTKMVSPLNEALHEYC